MSVCPGPPQGCGCSLHKNVHWCTKSCLIGRMGSALSFWAQSRLRVSAGVYRGFWFHRAAHENRVAFPRRCLKSAEQLRPGNENSSAAVKTARRLQLGLWKQPGDCSCVCVVDLDLPVENSPEYQWWRHFIQGGGWWKSHTEERIRCLIPMAYTCNPIYSGGKEQEGQGSRPARENSSQDPILKISNTHTHTHTHARSEWSSLTVLYKHYHHHL
jgi:hypothetical protein